MFFCTAAFGGEKIILQRGTTKGNGSNRQYMQGRAALRVLAKFDQREGDFPGSFRLLVTIYGSINGSFTGGLPPDIVT